MTKKLISVPPVLVDSFHEVTGLPGDEYFVACDPVGRKLGSGGGTIHLLEKAAGGEELTTYLKREKRILLHAGGMSRRLPAYAPVGKILTPVPVFRWARGQRIDQTLLSLQLPLYERISEMAGNNQHTLVCSGDVLITTPRPVPFFDTEADVVCFAIGVEAETAKNHGVYVCRRDNPTELDFMLQKPSPKALADLSVTHFYLLDIGVWLLSDKAVERMQKKYKARGEYDLYGEFGCALGNNPTAPDPELADLTVAIVPLDKGEFYHFGTTRDLISSTLRLQNRVSDGRDILHLKAKAHPSIFTQNCKTAIEFREDNEYTWIENSLIGSEFTISNHNVVTGVPTADLRADLKPGQCLDIVPIGEEAYAVRLYMFDDRMDGERQFAPLYGIARDISHLQSVLDMAMAGEVTGVETISAFEISNQANLRRLHRQRQALMLDCVEELCRNHERSVFYQLDLHHIAGLMRENGRTLPLDNSANLTLAKQISRAMLRESLGDESAKGEAFEILRRTLTEQTLGEKHYPRMDVAADQIVWARCPVRIDLAGGWTDTPPNCLIHGGDVVNIAIELNSQPPLQVYVKPCADPVIILRSIDMGVSETLHTRTELLTYNRVGNAFSIPKAALVLAGFGQSELEDELRALGCGMEITLLSAIPAGSGLGTSSILASTVLAAISDFANLGWDKNDVCHHTLVLEQMLTTGGGWQDQYGGVLHGIKRLTTTPGTKQTPDTRWLPDTLFTDIDNRQLHLLYYTGILRTAKQILDEIVRGMFLQKAETLDTLAQMRENADMLYDALLRGRMDDYGRCLRRTWALNKRLDAGTNPPAIDRLTSLVDDLCLGYKLPGAGGGGYLYMLAKDQEAAARIRKVLTENSQNRMARFVNMSISQTGLQVTRS